MNFNSIFTLCVITIVIAYSKIVPGTNSEASDVIFSHDSLTNYKDIFSAKIRAAIEMVEKGDLSGAKAIFSNVLLKDPNHLDANNLLGTIYTMSGEYQAAVHHFSRTFTEYNIQNVIKDLSMYSNYIEALRVLGQLEKAREVSQKALRSITPDYYKPESATFFANYAIIERRLGNTNYAVSLITQSINLKPNLSLAWRVWADLQFDQEKYDEIIVQLQKALELIPNDVDILFHLGTALHYQKRLEDAIRIYKVIEELQPSFVSAQSNLAAAYHEMGQTSKAIEYFEKIIPLLPNDAGVRNNYGALLGTINKNEEEIYWLKEALKINPNMRHALMNLAGYYQDEGNLEMSLEYFEKAIKLETTAGTSNTLSPIRIATMMSPVSESWDQMVYERTLMHKRVKTILKNLETSPVEKVPMDSSLDRIHFYITFHGLNDRLFQELIGSVYLSYISDLNKMSIFAQKSDIQQHLLHGTKGVNPTTKGFREEHVRRKRIGFISKFFGIFEPHGMLLDGIMKYLPKDQFEVVCLLVARSDEKPAAPTLIEACSEVHEISLSYQHGLEKLLSTPLDVLVFADVVSEPMNHFLLHSRFAPIQMAFWGNPVTTGSLAVDYYISADIMESPYRTRIPVGEDPYSEQVLLLEGQGIWYFRPVDPELELKKVNISHLVGKVQSYTRETFGLCSDCFIFLLPQSVFKIHPLYDLVLAEILLENPDSHLVVTGGRRASWTKMYVNRIRAVIGEANWGRFHMIERVSSENFYSLLSLANVILHPFPFDGSRTSADALIVQVPYVTLPTEYLRGRMGFAFLRTMNLPELVANDIQDYISIASRLAKDPVFYKLVKEKMARSVDLIWEDMGYPFHFTQVLQRLLGHPVMQWRDFLLQTGRDINEDMRRSNQREINGNAFDRAFKPQAWQLKNGVAKLDFLIFDSNIWPNIFESWRQSQKIYLNLDTAGYKSSDIDSAIVVGSKGLQQTPLPPPTPPLPAVVDNTVWLREFRRSMELGDYKSAYEIVKSQKSLPETDPAFLLDLGIMHYFRGEYEAAFQTCATASHIAPNASQIFGCMGVAGLYLPEKENITINALFSAFVLTRRVILQRLQGIEAKEIRSEVFVMPYDTVVFNLIAALFKTNRYDECVELSLDILNLPPIDKGGAHSIVFSRVDWSPEGISFVKKFEREFRQRVGVNLTASFSFESTVKRIQEEGDMLVNNMADCMAMSAVNKKAYFAAIDDFLSVIGEVQKVDLTPTLAPHVAGAKAAANQQKYDEEQGIALIIQNFITDDPVAQLDMNIALTKNLANGAIKSLHILTEKLMEFENFPHMNKLNQHVLGRRMTFQDAFNFANVHLRGRIVIIANADIYFDNSLSRLFRAPGGPLHSDTVIALLKWLSPRQPGGSITMTMRTDSQDSWIFRSPISQYVVDNSDFYMGIPRCDNRLARLLTDANYTVINPSFDIQSVELQRSIRTGVLYGMKNSVHGELRNVLLMDRLRFDNRKRN